jgi:protein-S-isoprenylcysteine O-methyltransferase Ste14
MMKAEHVRAALERASEWYEIALPPIGGVFPFLLLAPWAYTSHDPWLARHEVVDARALVAIILAGDLLMAVSYAFLGGSFSILVDARPLRDGGPYRLVRHPVYLAQFLTTLGVALDRLSPVEGGLWLLFVAIQVTRARLEEKKLEKATPGYAEYRARTWMFLPFIV